MLYWVLYCGNCYFTWFIVRRSEQKFRVWTLILKMSANVYFLDSINYRGASLLNGWMKELNADIVQMKMKKLSSWWKWWHSGLKEQELLHKQTKGKDKLQLQCVSKYLTKIFLAYIKFFLKYFFTRKLWELRYKGQTRKENNFIFTFKQFFLLFSYYLAPLCTALSNNFTNSPMYIM